MNPTNGGTHTDEPGRAPVWSAWPVGCRVVLRRRLPDGGFTDALGDLVQADATRAVVRTRRGDIVVEATDVVAGKRVPPPPVRRPREPEGDQA